MRRFKTQSHLSVYATVYLSMVFILVGCSSLTVSTPIVPRTYPEGLVGEEKILISGFKKEGGKCFEEEAEKYLKGSNKFTVFRSPDPLDDKPHDEFIKRRGINLILSGEIEKYTADIRVAEGFWEGYLIAYAIASANMKVINTRTNEIIWSKKDSVFVEGEAKGRASKEKAKDILLPVACKNLTSKMLNDFLRVYER